jgi:cell division protein FtsB
MSDTGSPSRRRKSTRTVVIAVLSLALAGAIAAALLILPVKAWLNQRSALDSGREELRELEMANAELQADVDRLRTRAGIIQAAREELNAVRKREKVWRVLAAPDLPVAFPDGWLYPTIESLIVERIAGTVGPQGGNTTGTLITEDNVSIPTTAPGAATAATVVP